MGSGSAGSSAAFFLSGSLNVSSCIALGGITFSSWTLGARRANKSNCSKGDRFIELLSKDFKSSSIFFRAFDSLIIGLGGGNRLALIIGLGGGDFLTLGLSADLFSFLTIGFALGSAFFFADAEGTACCFLDDGAFSFGDNSIRSNRNVGTTICSWVL